MAYYDRVTTTHARTNECEPARCPECGGLECLCRPRFFAGQLLTDEDLNRLDHYIVEKNKLHNRYLHGWGVVCGLEVVCHPCDMVTVRSGYALSPCGEDIVVCRDDTVDVCALIKQCRDKERRRWECDPSDSRGDDPNCRDVTEDWILSIRYEEKPSRGITALKGASGSTCSTSCTCGGSSACGCGGGGSAGGCGCGGGGGCGCSQRGGAATKQTAKGGCKTTGGKSAAPPPQCEPTVVCEGYVYEVCKVPVRQRDPEQRDLGALINRALQCFKCLTEALPLQPSANAGRAQWHQWCCQLKEALLDYLASHPVYDCSLAERIAQFICPDPNSPQFDTDAQYIAAVNSAVQTIIAPVGAAYIFYCFCSAFLPPCPGPVEDPRVPLAVVTVRKGNCRVVRVCNLSYRKFATTFPNLQYWLSPLPFVRQFRKVLESICCRALPSFTRPPATPVPGQPPSTTVPGGPPPPPPPPPPVTPAFAASAAETEAASASASALRDAEFVKALTQAWENRNRNIDGETLFLGAVGARDAQGQPFLTPSELENPFTLLMLNRVLGPTLREVSDEAPGVLRKAVAAGGGGTHGDDDEVSALRAQLAELSATVKQQQEQINAHEERLKGQQSS